MKRIIYTLLITIVILLYNNTTIQSQVLSVDTLSKSDEINYEGILYDLSESFGIDILFYEKILNIVRNKE